MLLSQSSRNRGGNEVADQVTLSKLRKQLEHPDQLDGASRSYLSDLARRLKNVHARGGDFARAGFSQHAQAALNGSIAG